MAGTDDTKRKASSITQAETIAKRAKIDVRRPGNPPSRPREQVLESVDDEENEEHDHRKESTSARTKGKLREHQDASEEGVQAPKVSYRKLAPPRPFPTVPASVSATGPRSTHVEGKNIICITRKTPLGAYLRRCKDVVMKDGHKTLHLSAMGAAIPHLMQLAVSLPDILPHARDEIRTEVFTGTVEVQDEVIPEDEDEDISYRLRGKSTASVVITIGDGIDEGARTGKGRKNTSRAVPPSGGSKSSRDQMKRPQQGKRADGRGATSAGARQPEPVVIRVEDVED